jgi:acyl-coenzyme A thioesterase PaaI-like protein
MRLPMLPPATARPEPPPLSVPADWQPLEPLRIEGGRGSFVSGEPGNERLRVAYFRRGDGRLVGRAWFGPGALGPPGHAHGGAVAAVLDEAMGAAAWQAGLIGVAASLATEFRRMLPLGTDAMFEAWVEEHQGRKVHTAGRLTGEDGTLYAEARALFVRLDPERDRAMLQRVASAMGRDLEEVLAALRAGAR